MASLPSVSNARPSACEPSARMAAWTSARQLSVSRRLTMVPIVRDARSASSAEAVETSFISGCVAIAMKIHRARSLRSLPVVLSPRQRARTSVWLCARHGPASANRATTAKRKGRMAIDRSVRGWSSVNAQRRLDVAHHGDEARAEVVLELPLLHHERRHDAVEGHDLAVHVAAHRRADGVDLAAQLARADAEAAAADLVQRLVDRRAVLLVRLGLL